jgi:hypothetical protein
MGWLEFSASLVKSLAWPVTAFALVMLLRAPLRQALFKVTRLKYKDLELDFGRELKQLEEEARAVDITPVRPTSVAPTDRSSTRLLEEAARLAHGLPEPAIALGWQAVEDELLSTVMHLKLSPDYPPDQSAMKNAEVLREQNAIDQRTLAVLDRLRALRNMAVHNIRAIDITTAEAIEFLALARGVVGKLQALRRM